LDRQWVEDHFNQIFDEENEVHFGLTLSSCLSEYSPISKDIYILFTGKDMFQKALTLYDTQSSALDTIMRYTIWEYHFWRVNPAAPGSILGQVLEKKNDIQLQRLLQIIWKFKVLDRPELKFIWEKILAIARTDSEKYKKVLYSLPWLLELYGEIDAEIFEFLKETCKAYTENGHDPNNLIRTISRMPDTNLGYSSDLIIQILRSIQSIPYANDEIYSLVEKCYKNNLTNKANSIVRFYEEKASLVLKPLYDKYNT
jgi:hypothetical protein